MNTTAEIRTLFQMLRGQIRSGSHAERLDAFYAPQAHSYDAFRERLLHGRNSLINILKPDTGSHVVELGAGTGRNIEFFGDRIATFAQLDLVDVCKPLLEQARQRAARWPKVVNVVEADVERFRPARAVDCVYLSYSLSMTANWKKTLNNAVRMLRPGGTLGVVDFYVSDAAPPPGQARHGWFARQFWPRWFAHDGVRLNPAHLTALADCTDTVHLDQRLAPVPWLPALRVPYYVYVGRKRRT